MHLAAVVSPQEVVLIAEGELPGSWSSAQPAGCPSFIGWDLTVDPELGRRAYQARALAESMPHPESPADRALRRLCRVLRVPSPMR